MALPELEESGIVKIVVKTLVELVVRLPESEEWTPETEAHVLSPRRKVVDELEPEPSCDDGITVFEFNEA